MEQAPVRFLIRYAFFATLSIIINIGSQFLSIWIYEGPFAVEISILVGTAAGLPIRYFLEKRYIFGFTNQSLAQDSKLFVFYSAMGAVTTLIFWGTEYLFFLIYDSELMRYAGGIIGLVVGFYLKYSLDKRYVFVETRSRELP